jgi:hypothetical protein
MLRQNIIFGVPVLGVDLHAGEQSIPPVKARFAYYHDDGSPYETMTTMGVVVSKTQYTFRGAVRHPWSYLKHLVRKL